MKNGGITCDADVQNSPEVPTEREWDEDWMREDVLHSLAALSAPYQVFQKEASSILAMLSVKRRDVWMPFLQEVLETESTQEWRNDLRDDMQNALCFDEAADQISDSDIPFSQIPNLLDDLEVRVFALVALITQIVILEIPDKVFTGLEQDFEADHFKLGRDTFFVVYRQGLDEDERLNAITGELVQMWERIRFSACQESPVPQTSPSSVPVLDENSYDVLRLRLLDPRIEKPNTLSVTSLGRLLTGRRLTSRGQEHMRCVLLPKLVKDGILLHRSESKLKLNLFTKYAVLDGADERQTMIEWSEITKDRIETEILLFKTLMNDESLVDQAENVHRATPIFCDSERDFCDLLNGDLALHTVALGSNTKKRQEVRRLIHERYLQVPTFVNRARPVSIAHEHAVMIDLIRKKDLEKLKKYLAKHLRTCFADLAKSPSFEAALREGMKSISVDA